MAIRSYFRLGQGIGPFPEQVRIALGMGVTLAGDADGVPTHTEYEPSTLAVTALASWPPFTIGPYFSQCGLWAPASVPLHVGLETLANDRAVFTYSNVQCNSFGPIFQPLPATGL
jgi:hypothetical protein